MAAKKVKTSRINRAAPMVASDVSMYCRDLESWPRSWMGLEKELPPGEALVECFRPFIGHLVSAGLSPSILRRHIDNLWSLGGEIIRELHYDPPLRKRTAERLLRDMVHADGGPLVHNGSEDQQRSFDATCRKLHRFLIQSQL